MAPDRWILSSVQPQHIYSHLLVCTLVPWFPFSLLVGDLESVNGIHQWLVIIWWTTMFNLNTSIHIVGHVLVAVCVEYLPAWWHSMYSTSLTVLVFMRYQISWFDSIVYQISSSIMEILIHCILYVVMSTHDICISCLFMDIVLLCIRSCYMYICIHMQRLIIVLYWWVAGSSTWVFITPLLGWI